MIVLAGLGNPGLKYAFTRHNLGFLFLDYLCDNWNLNCNFKKKFDYYYDIISFCNQKMIFVKPDTFMNLSGIAVKEVLNYYKLNEGSLIVCHDDKDLECGDVRFKKGGGAGGHNGLKHIISGLGTQDFLRIRFGIKTERLNEVPLSAFVLEKFTEEEEVKYVEAFKKAMKGLEILLCENNLNEAIKFVNTK